MEQKQYVKLGDEEICIDRSRLHFTEATLTEYIESEGGWIDYFGAKLAEAEMDVALAEVEYESVYSKKFAEYKPQGSDKLVEALTKSDSEVEMFRRMVIQKKCVVRLLQQHLRAWDKNHENAQSRGHFLRKEMDRLHRDVIKGTPENYLERKIEQLVPEVDPNDLDFNTTLPV